MNLPTLPKIHQKKEADFGLRFRTWFKDNSRLFESGSFELKDTRGKDYLNFNEVKSVQIASGLKNQSDEGNLMRASVATTGTADYLFYRNAKGWIVIKYPKMFCIISLDNFIQEKETSDRKSLTSEDARRIAWLVI